MTKAPLLEVRGLAKRLGNFPVLSDINLDLAPGEILALLGQSGSGKSTLLRCIAGFEQLDCGTIQLTGRRIDQQAPEQRGVGIVFQDYALFPHLDVLRNISFAMPGLPAAQRPKRAADLIAMLQLDGLEARYPDELSGGQQQRVALARTLAASPSLVLLDEPFASLDAGLRETARREIRKILKQEGIGFILVTHDREEALSLADRIGVLEGGRILQEGSPAEIYERPANAFIAKFLGRTNLLAGTAAGQNAQTALGPLRITAAASGPVLLSVRPEALLLLADPGGNAVVTDQVYRGRDVTCWFRLAHAAVGDVEWQADLPAADAPAVGAVVRIEQRGEAVVLPQEGQQPPSLVTRADGL